jgi:hypothetical protein
MDKYDIVVLAIVTLPLLPGVAFLLWLAWGRFFRFRYSLRALFALVTLCALATPVMIELVAYYREDPFERDARLYLKALDDSLSGGFRGVDAGGR